MPVRKERDLRALFGSGGEYSRSFKEKTYVLKVIREAAGGYRYVIGKETFSSPTAAAKDITKSEVNGWKFWSYFDEDRKDWFSLSEFASDA